MAPTECRAQKFRLSDRLQATSAVESDQVKAAHGYVEDMLGYCCNGADGSPCAV
jgi:hypothetical protein